MSDQSPPVFGDRYEIQSKIGRGGMADVFLAHDRLLDRPVAIKVLFPEFANDPSFVERFRREAQAAANLTHPNVVAVFDWGQEGTTYFIVMEYVAGRTLSDILRSEGPLEPKRAAAIAAEVTGALSVAHRNGLVHRDVKPGNILVTAHDEVKVADFGIARALNDITDSNLTQAGAVMGTATYFSPEQAQGHSLDARSDLYSLGVVMYEMGTGQPPFRGENPVAIAYKQVHEMPVAPIKLNPNISPGYERIVRRLLQKDPSKRYQTADDLRADLRRFGDGTLADPVTEARAMPMAGAAAAVAAGSPQTQAMPGVTARGTEAYQEATRMVTPVTAATATTATSSANGGQDGHSPNRGPLIAILTVVTIAILAGIGVALWQALRSDQAKVAQVAIVNVVNKTQDEAIGALRNQGFSADRIRVLPGETSNPALAGRVLAQSPAAGQMVSTGSEVTLQVGQLPGSIPVPNVVGQPQPTAQKTLEAAGFKVSVQNQESPDQPQGTVMSQQPAAGSTAGPGSVITLVVSAGKGQAPVDDVTGMTEFDAVAALARSGFAPQKTTEPSDTVPQGNVIRTDPAAGTVIPKGSQVTLVVSSGAAPVPVPKVTDQSEAQATQTLTAAGFQVQVLNLNVADPAQVGKVVDQAPAAGSKQAKGTVVAITVGRAAPPPPTTAPPTTAPPTPPSTEAPPTS